jgi:hypothetical protein
MDQVNTMKYDELTLMQFADGELDESLTAEIESAKLHDKELQAYLEVFETTRSALIDSAQEEIIPSHINDLIDNFSPTKKQNWLAEVVKNNPFKSLFSTALASIIAMQAVLLGLGGAITATQFAATGVKIVPDINNVFQNSGSSGEFRAASSKNAASNALIEAELSRALLENPNTLSIVISFDQNFTTLNILGDFVDANGGDCKIAQLDDQYLIVCKSQNMGWKIQPI